MNAETNPVPTYTKTLRLPSITAEVRKVEQFILQAHEAVHFDEDTLDCVMISVTEAVNNAIMHGNRTNPKKYVSLTFNCYSDSFEFIVSDEGPGFDPSSVPNPIHEDNLLKEGGRGILIITTMMDDVSFTKTPNGMKLIMRIGRS
ncbi:MAG: ATP-binding protein [Ectothiorhodospiraceae bacterium]|nr:ATP-binding protein [Ectothiorhodospiraceae bacterium]